VTQTVRILSIDGGGIRGIIPATVLAHIERAAGGFPIHRMFDLIAGTSTGAILAAGLTRPIPFSAAALSDLYLSRGAEIFRRSAVSYIRSAISGPKYDAVPLEDILHGYFGTRLLSDCVTPLLVPAYDLERREAHFFKSWRAGTTPSVNFLLRSVVRAATAAPTYFSPALIYSMGGDRLAAVDGAIFANNPAMCALAEARVLYPNATKFIIVSLGVGEFRKPISYDSAKGWGLLAWAPPVIDCAMDGTADTVHYQIKECFGANVKYHRFQIDLNGANGPTDCIDDASDTNILKLINRAKALIAENADDLGRLAVTLPSYAAMNEMALS
jgi:uncharacterized protein